MSDKSTVDAYQKIADEFHSRNSAPLYEELYSIFASYLTSGKRVIEIGCGTARDAGELMKLDIDYTGIDASTAMLDVARSLFKEGKFFEGDFYKLDFPDNSFDGFWAAASFLHVPKADISIVLSEAKRVVKPEGIGFISMKVKTFMDEGYIKEAKAGGIERYFAFYTQEELAAILQKNNFEILSSTIKIEKDGTHWLCNIMRSKK